MLSLFDSCSSPCRVLIVMEFDIRLCAVESIMAPLSCALRRGHMDIAIKERTEAKNPFRNDPAMHTTPLSEYHHHSLIHSFHSQLGQRPSRIGFSQHSNIRSRTISSSSSPPDSRCAPRAGPSRPCTSPACLPHPRAPGETSRGRRTPRSSESSAPCSR